MSLNANRRAAYERWALANNAKMRVNISTEADQVAQLAGFASAAEKAHLVAAADLSTPDRLATFEHWKLEDGSKAGLLQLSTASAQVTAAFPAAAVADFGSALGAYIAEARRKPFAWGVHDCCLWAAGAVRIKLGLDYAAELRGTYRDARGAAAVLRRRYGGSAWNVPAKHGLASIDAKLAQRGDILGAEVDKRRALGVCAGVQGFFVGKKGLVTVATLACARAWRVG